MGSNRRTYVIGTGGLAREMAQLFETCNDGHQIDGFIAASRDEVGLDFGYAPVVGDDDWLLKSQEGSDLILGIGYPQIRARVLERYTHDEDRFRFPTLVHPSALLDTRRVQLGRGNVITAGCVITTEVRIGDFNLFNWNATVGHDVQVGSSCVINPAVNLSGYVTIGDRVLLGTGSQVLERLTIHDDAVVGAGAVVTRDVADGQTVTGIPARPHPE